MMQPRRHWTPRYVVDRCALALWQRTHPHAPWLTADAVALLDQLVKKTDVCFEWGSGRSTHWLAERSSSVTSIEHDEEWAARVRRDIAGLPGASLRLVPPVPDAYSSAISAEALYHVILVDGIFRDACALAAIDHLAPGGVLVIDNVERHLPSQSRSPEAIGDRYETEDWRRFAERVATWRRVWTSNGVYDTALFICP